MESDWSLVELLKSFYTWVSLSMASLVAWFAKRQIKRIDNLERNKLGETTFNNTLESLRKDNERYGDQMTKNFDRLSNEVRDTNKRIDRVLEKKAGITG